MKLQKRFLRKHKNKDYYKYVINIPPLMVKEAGFEEGEELKVDVKDGKLTIKKTKNKK
ncbi:AbrB/MazE/SpoVT family DNA-binding domain-containing protein [Candidatus Pacearchaeota archaeon]|nr:AbrB/MazE/SpoVT family DNA-binding domain-containing protein [Candidatus Pacearchaeota archaeon]